MSLSSDMQLLREIYANHADGYVVEFEKALASIAERHDPASICGLCDLFDDNADFDELMFSIIHTIERFDDDIYIRELLEAAPEFCSRSPRWASIVFMRVLNSDASRRTLVLQLRNAPPRTKDVLRNLMERINQRGVQFLEKTTPVIIAAS